MLWLPPCSLRRTWFLRFGLIFFGLVCFGQFLVLKAQTDTELNGTVVNRATGARLEGAVVEIASINRRVLTDSLGRYSLVGVPQGNHLLTVNYLGLDTRTVPVDITQTGRTVMNVEMDSSVYQMQAMSVVGEREGNAAALTAQRNADNVKNVVALDSYGNLPNGEPGELLIRLPGIAASPNGEGVVSEVTVRGTNHTLNSVTVDGNKMASSGGMNRNFRTNSIPGAFFERIEVSKSLTPDLDADSLGGVIDMKTRNALNMTEKRRVIYRAGAKWAPPFFTHNPATRGHPIHPMFSLAYQEAFDVGKGTRNLGIAISAFYSENATTAYQLTQDYEYTRNPRAYVWDYRSADIYNNRKNTSLTLKVNYQLTDEVEVFFGAMYNDAHEKAFEYLRTRAYTSRNIAAINSTTGLPTGNNAIMPDYTATVTNVRAVPSSNFELQSDGNRFEDSQRQLHVGAIHKYAKLHIDYDAAHSESLVRQNDGHNSSEIGSGGFFRTWLTGVGWTIDKTSDPAKPRFIQTAGPSIFDLRNYTNSELHKRNNERNGILNSASANVKYLFDGKETSYIKAGARVRRQTAEEIGRDRRWSYSGPDGIYGVNPSTGMRDDDLSIFAFPGVQTSESQRNGPFPYTHIGTVGEHVKKNPALWTENLYYTNTQKYIGTRKVTEDVTAAYIMGGTQWGKLRAVGGIRNESTEVKSQGYVRSRTLATAAQIPDPVARADADYNNFRVIRGSYDNLFPSAYLTYYLARNSQHTILMRVNGSQSLGRPAFSSLVPLETADTTNQILNINNPSIKPQYARNLDATFEYYFKPVGALVLGVFTKDIKDFIVTTSGAVVPDGPDNGFGGEYGGYTLNTQVNGGKAKITGIEASFQQQFSFLPGIWKGLGCFINYTYLTTEGDYGTLGPRTTHLVPNFVPKSGNAGLSFKWRRFQTQVMVNYTGEHLTSYSTDASRLNFKFERTVANLNFSYSMSPRLQFYCDFQNVFDEPQKWYRGVPEHIERAFWNGSFINFGISGRF